MSFTIDGKYIKNKNLVEGFETSCPQGPQGPRGPKGPTGEKGVIGNQGPQGDTGPIGPSGTASDKLCIDDICLSSEQFQYFLDMYEYSKNYKLSNINNELDTAGTTRPITTPSLGGGFRSPIGTTRRITTPSLGGGFSSPITISPEGFYEGFECTSGPAGPIGIEGPLGDDGLAGPRGAKGEPGIMGPPGPKPGANASLCVDELCLEKKHLQHFIELYNFNKN